VSPLLSWLLFGGAVFYVLPYRIVLRHLATTRTDTHEQDAL
jgi:hypothetical protein